MNPFTWIVATMRQANANVRQAFKEYLCDHRWPVVFVNGKRSCLDCGAVQDFPKHRPF